MIREDRELGLNAEPEDIDDSAAIPPRESVEEDQVPAERDVLLDESDTESIEAALAEFAINEQENLPAPAQESILNTQHDADQDGASDDDHHDGEEAKEQSHSAEPQMSKRDKRRAREARKKVEAEAAANNQTEVSRVLHSVRREC